MAHVASRSSTGDPRQQLAEAIATKKEQLRRMEARLRQKQQRLLHEQYLRVGKVVEALGLLEVETGELETLLKVGLEARTQGDARAMSAAPDADTK